MSEKERQAQMEALFKDIANIVAEKCVNPDTRRPYPVSMIERAMHDIHYAVKPTQSAKQQVFYILFYVALTGCRLWLW